MPRNDITERVSNLISAINESDLHKYGYEIGDYFKGSSGCVYHLADLNTYFGGYDSHSVLSTPHLACVVDSNTLSIWGEVIPPSPPVPPSIEQADDTDNDTEEPSTSYSTSILHSYLESTILPMIEQDLAELFHDETSHVLLHDKLLTDRIDGYKWISCKISALTESEIYGHAVYSANACQEGEAIRQLEIFRSYRFNEIFGNKFIWLRNMYSDSMACYAGNGGHPGNYGVENEGGAVGIILIA